MTEMTPAELLRRSADHIQRVGLNQNGHFFADASELNCNVSCCTIGAMACVLDIPAYIALWANSAARAARRLLGEKLKVDSISVWNDTTDRVTVLQTLRELADELETGEMEVTSDAG